MKKRIISYITVFMMVVTIISAGTVPVSAAVTEGGMAWSYKCPASGSISGVSSPVTDGNYVYLPSGTVLYKFNKNTGKLAAKLTMSGTVGMNKLPPATGGGKIFVALNGGKLDIIDMASMSLEKTVVYDEIHRTSQSLTPVVYDSGDNAVYLGSWQGGSSSNPGGGIYVKVDLGTYKVTELTEGEEPCGFYWAGACTEGEYVVFGSDSSSTDGNATSDGSAVLYAYRKSDGRLFTDTIENSGSICSTIVKENGAYYFTTKGGKLYEAVINESDMENPISCIVKSDLAGSSTCTPIIVGGVAYIGSSAGSEGRIQGVAIGSIGEKGSISKLYKTPGEVKTLALSPTSETLYATYYKAPGGIFAVNIGNMENGREYFVPDTGMQQFCISAIATDAVGTLYYANDSNYLMAVKGRDSAASMRLSSVKAPGSSSVKLYGYDDIKFSWSKSTGATGYYVYYKKSTSSKYTYLGSTKNLSAYKANLTDGAKYFFRVYPYVEVGGKKYRSSSYKVSPSIYTLKKTSISKVSKASRNYVKVKWKNIYGESGYQIARSKYSSKKYSVVKTVSSKYSYSKLKTTRGKSYYYKVRAYKTVSGKKIYGPWSSAKKYKLR